MDAERPTKRQKLDPNEMQPLPLDIMLLSLPHLLLHPPTHRSHIQSLFLSWFALQKYLSLPNLESHLECRAWTELAEIGFKIGLDAPGIESEVEKALTKALLIAHKHPSLRIYKPSIIRLSARLASAQNNSKLSQNTLKKVITHFLAPSDPIHVIYSAHLSYISCLETGTLRAIGEFHALATKNNHYEVQLLAMVLELRDLVFNGIWNKILESLSGIEKILDSMTSTNKLVTALTVHVLIIGVLYYTYTGDNENAQYRLKKLHDMLDGNAFAAFGSNGVIELESIPQLSIQVTHPRIIFMLGFLVSSVSKRDPVGRKPKRKVFAIEGVRILERELKSEVLLPTWASIEDLEIFNFRMYKMKADMICEIIGVSISRSEFDDAEKNLAQVIALTRTHQLFPLYSSRITLHQAHLAHSLGQTERALKCYEVAAFLSRPRSTKSSSNSSDDDGCEDHWVNVSARAGELWLRVGQASYIEGYAEKEAEMEKLRKSGEGILKECQGHGGTLQIVGSVLGACLSKEFLAAKTHLRSALNQSTSAQDNHLRALVLSLVAAQYIHTSMEHAEKMLSTAEQLAAGLGAQPKVSKHEKKHTQKSPNDGVGNAHLRLWIGERLLELKRRAGDDMAISKQTSMNDKFRDAVVKVEKRKIDHT